MLADQSLLIKHVGDKTAGRIAADPQGPDAEPTNPNQSQLIPGDSEDA
jgi:hypothetical protein